MTTNPRSVRADALRILEEIPLLPLSVSSRYLQLYRDLEAADGALAVLVDVAIAATAQSGSVRYRGADLTRRLMRLGWAPPAALDPILEGGDDDD